MKNRQIDLFGPHGQSKSHKKNDIFSSIATLPGIFQQITPTKSLETFWTDYGLCIVIGLNSQFLGVFTLFLFQFNERPNHPLNVLGLGTYQIPS